MGSRLTGLFRIGAIPYVAGAVSATAKTFAKAALAATAGAKAARIVTLDLFPGRPVGAQRHNGFLKGFGLPAPEAKSNELGKDAAVLSPDQLPAEFLA